MPYKPPLISLLSDRRPDYSSYKSIADSQYAELTACFEVQNVKVSQEGYKISPVNTVFNYRLDPDISYKKVKSLQPELSMAVGCDVSIFSSSEEGHYFSVSVPRDARSYVGLGQLLSSKEFKESRSPLTIAVGVNEQGGNEVFDLQEAPHLLISGTTGSGKTVYLDDVILSMLYKASPKMVKLVLIDPSAKDFNVYNGLPHLLFPVASDKDNIYEVVKYVRNRMDERYRRLARSGKRNVQTYTGRGSSYFTRIVVVIDKYMELTYEMPPDFEECISEIARKGRAAGIHLIINTQTARSEVINNGIKANMPYRVAFSVTDWHESKAILDKTGAQKLLGNGDMLYASGLNSIPKHIQAPNVTLDEIKRIVANVIERNGQAKYVNDFDDSSEPIEDNVALIREVLEKLSNMNNVDVSILQNQMNLDYSEATEMIKFLEENGIVSEYEGNKGRTVDHAEVERMIDELDV